MWSHVFARCVTLLLVIWSVFAQDSQNDFIDPAPGSSGKDFTLNNVYSAGSVINIRWKTNFEKLSLAIWQNDNSSFQYLPDMKEVPQRTSFRWTVDKMDFDLANGDVFFLMVFDETGTGNKFGSRYFNISQDSTPISSSVSSSSSTAEATPNSSTASAPSTSITPNTTPTPTPNDPSASQNTPAAAASDSGLNTAAKAGIGVGVSVGVLGIAIGIMGLLLLRRSRQIPKETGTPVERLPEYGGAYTPEFHGSYAPVEAYKFQGTPHEMATHADAQELSATAIDRPGMNGGSNFQRPAGETTEHKIQYQP